MLDWRVGLVRILLLPLQAKQCFRECSLGSINGFVLVVRCFHGCNLCLEELRLWGTPLNTAFPVNVALLLGKKNKNTTTKSTWKHSAQTLSHLITCGKIWDKYRLETVVLSKKYTKQREISERMSERNKQQTPVGKRKMRVVLPN